MIIMDVMVNLRQTCDDGEYILTDMCHVYTCRDILCGMWHNMQ